MLQEFGVGGDQGERGALAAMWRGFGRHCPECGRGLMFAGYTRVNAICPNCGCPLDQHRADDAPPYFTILIVAHIVVPLILLMEQHYHPPEWVQLSVWLPMTLALTVWFLPRIKGALIGLQWAKRMHGFGGHPD